LILTLDFDAMLHLISGNCNTCCEFVLHILNEVLKPVLEELKMKTQFLVESN